MTTQKKKKSAKEKKVLIGSVVVAAAIVAGSTFAWFSSKDEVTNRLTASADYNVSIVEDFQPPKEWIPGQTVNKDVAAVNTGNVDAFVRMWLGGAMRVLNESNGLAITTTNGSNTTVATDATSFLHNTSNKVNDEAKTKLGLNYQQTNSGAVTYYKTLSTDKINNPNDLNHDVHEHDDPSDPVGTGDNQYAGFSEVQSMQAGGVLVYAPANAKYTWTLEQASDLIVNGTLTQLENLPKGTQVGSIGSGAAKELAKTTNNANDSNYYGEIDASTFKPATTGLYLFRRNIGETADGTANTYEYSGYYYDNDLDGGTYFALKTKEGANKHSDYVLEAAAVDDNSTANPTLNQVLPVIPKDIKLFNATETVKTTDQLTWTYDSTNTKFTVTNNEDPAISIDVQLANVKAATESDSENWTAMPDATTPQKTTFYYNNDVEAGDTTAKLVDSVTLSQNTKNGAYLALDFDLNVFMDSVQVTMTEDGKEGVTTVQNWLAAGYNDDTANTHAVSNTPAKGSITTQTGSEIDLLKWENA